MSMTLRLTDEQDRALTALAGAEGVSKNEAAIRAILERAQRDVRRESIVRNNPLIDGNKRLGWLAAAIFLDINGFTLDAPPYEAYDLVIGATGRFDYHRVAIRLGSWTTGV